MRKIILGLILIVILITLIFKTDNLDTITYQGKTYVYLETNMDIFTYLFNSNVFYEEDIIKPIEHNKWDIVYQSGDLFVLKKQSKKAIKYYKDDNNYNWFIEYEKDDIARIIPINMSDKEIKYLYRIEDIPRDKSIVFDDIKEFVNIIKISKDNLIKAVINLVNYKDSWYFKTEIMTDNDEEYIIKLPSSLNNKIFKLLEGEKNDSNR